MDTGWCRLPLIFLGGFFLGPRLCLVFFAVSRHAAPATGVAANCATLIRRKIPHGSAPSPISIPVPTCPTAKARAYPDPLPSHVVLLGGGNTPGLPNAALFRFCLAWLAYNPVVSWKGPGGAWPAVR